MKVSSITSNINYVLTFSHEVGVTKSKRGSFIVN